MFALFLPLGKDKRARCRRDSSSLLAYPLPIANFDDLIKAAVPIADIITDKA